MKGPVLVTAPEREIAAGGRILVAPELRDGAGMRASGAAIHAHTQVGMSPHARWGSDSKDVKGFGSLLDEFGIPSGQRASTSTRPTAATAVAPAARVKASPSTVQGAPESAASEPSATESSYVAPVKTGINLGPRGSAISPEQAAENQADRLAAANQASADAAAARNLTISDYLAPGDSLSNYAAGTTIDQLVQGYSITVPNMADPKAGEYANTGRVIVNGAAITGLVPDPYGGPAAPLGSTAAAMFQIEGATQKGGLPPSLKV